MKVKVYVYKVMKYTSYKSKKRKMKKKIKREGDRDDIREAKKAPQRFALIFFFFFIFLHLFSLHPNQGENTIKTRLSVRSHRKFLLHKIQKETPFLKILTIATNRQSDGEEVR